MTWLDSLLAGWEFRTATPAFETGEVITAHLTGTDEDGGTVRVGDTVIRVEGADGVPVERLVRVEITGFDAETHVGTGTVVEVLDEAV